MELTRRVRQTVTRLSSAGPGAQLDRLQAQLGRMESRTVAALEPGDLRAAEFRVFSQFGEDGIIQHLIHHVPIADEVFVELGVDDYRESNTRFLLVNDNWRGLIVDADDAHRRFVEATGLAWRHTLDARAAYVDRDNVNALITGAGIGGDIGLLSLDIDGHDYWVLRELEAVSPRILVLEYNSTFGPDAAVTVPYEAGFWRGQAHASFLYWGASLAALTRAAETKGMALVGGNSAGNNAFYVRRDVLGALPEVSVAEAYAPSRFRESRGAAGKLSYVTEHEDRLRLMREMPLWDVEAERTLTVAERFGV